jgi:23S rRNA (cytosine1962-C5)-methyltransferase
MPHIILKKSRERSVLQHHPWVFSGAVEKSPEIAENGQTVEIRTHHGKPIALAAWSGASQICARVWSFDPGVVIDDTFISSLVMGSIERRKNLFSDPNTNAFRLINAESDGIPGLIVDRYAGYLVCQFLSAGSEYWRATILKSLVETIKPEGIFERSDPDSRTKEGLEKKTGVLYGSQPPETIIIRENQVYFCVDIKTGHKTGFYLDQRNNRSILPQYCAGKEILNCFSYTGGFGVSALVAGAHHVTSIDSSAGCLKMLEANLELNGIDKSRSTHVEGDAFKVLRTYRDSLRNFDLIILDPPKFAESKSQLVPALRGYKDINLLAMKLLNPGGYLFTFSCSGHILPEMFMKVVSEAAVDSGRNCQMEKMLIQSPDHPVILNFPESLYLKGLVCRVW